MLFQCFYCIFLEDRRKAYLRYVRKLKKINSDIIVPNYENYKDSSFHLFLINLNFNRLKCSKDELFKYLNKNKIFPQFHYIPIYKFTYYKHLQNKYEFTSSDSYYDSALSLPLYYKLSEKDLIKITSVVKKIINKYAI